MINLALVGAGKWGSNCLRAAKHVSDCRIAYVASRDYRTLIKHPDIDGIIIATPASTHFEIARFFLEKNYHVLIEKPMTTRLADALRLQAMYEKETSIVMIGHIYLHNPAFHTFIDAIPSVGRLQYLLFESGNYGPFRSDVSALWDWGSHDISMCLAVVGKDPVAVTCWGMVDMVAMRLDFERFPSVYINTGRLRPEKRRYAIAMGTNAGVVFDDLSDKKVTVYGFNDKIERSYPRIEHEEPLICQLRSFVEAIRRGYRQTDDFLMGMRVVSVLHAAEQSVRHYGKTIRIKS